MTEYMRLLYDISLVHRENYTILYSTDSSRKHFESLQVNTVH